MPSPVGHALGGALAATLVMRTVKPLGSPVLWASMALAMAPDLDLLFGTHNSYTHSIGAVVIAWAMSRVVLGLQPSATPGHTARCALALGTAYASHLMLDALGTDRAQPIGIMVWWPFSHEYDKLPFSLFPPVPRDVWAPGFWSAISRALAAEVALLGVALWVTSRLTRRSESTAMPVDSAPGRSPISRGAPGARE